MSQYNNFALSVVVTLLVVAIAIAATAVSVVLKKRGKIRLWFEPIGVSVPLVSGQTKMFDCYSVKSRNLTWIFFLSLSSVYLVIWFFGYFVVNVILLSEWNSFVNHNGTRAIYFLWNKDLILSNGQHGGYSLSIDGTTFSHDLSFLMKQTNVDMYLTQLLIYKISLLKGIPFNADDPITKQTYETIESYLSSPLYRQELSQAMFWWLHSFVYSNIFVTPLCQFLSFAFPLSIVLSRNRDYASFFAPFAVLGGFVTVVGGIAFDPSQVVTWQFIFFDQQLFFFYHTFLLVIGSVWLGINNRYSLKRIGIMIALTFTYIFYVLIVANILGINYFTTALTKGDVEPGGSYEILYEVLPNAFPSSSVLMLLLFLSAMFTIVAIKSIFHSRYWKKMGVKNYNFRSDIINFCRGCSFYFKKLINKFSHQRLKKNDVV